MLRTRSTEHLMFRFELHRAGNLAGAEAAGAHMNVCRGAIHDRLHALDVGLPGTIGTTVRMRHLNTKSHALVAKLALCHPLHLLAVVTSCLVIRKQKLS